MYLEFYGLLKEPFHITPDPEFLYLSPSHKEALGVILYGVENRAGFMMITGGVGLGKTTILRSAMQQFDPEHVKTVLVFNPCISYRELVKLIYEELGIEIPEADDQFPLIQRLHLALIEEYKKGSNVVLVIDEAQNMPMETLENLRMLSNLETSKDKLIQIILVGQQPELENLLNSDALRQLKQRIAYRATLVKLTPKESADYIRHRLDIAIGVRDLPFTQSAIKSIVKHCEGVPRCINIVCSNALVSGFGSSQKPIKPALVREAIDDLEGRQRKPRNRWVMAPIALLLASLLLYFYSTGKNSPLKRLTSSTTGSQETSDVTTLPAKPQDITPKTAIPSTVERTSEFNRTEAPPKSMSPAKPEAAPPSVVPSQQVTPPKGESESAKPLQPSTTASMEDRSTTGAPHSKPLESKSETIAETVPPPEKRSITPETATVNSDISSTSPATGSVPKPGAPLKGEPKPQEESTVQTPRPATSQPAPEAPKSASASVEHGATEKPHEKPLESVSPPPTATETDVQPSHTAPSTAAREKPSEKQGSPDPSEIIDWLIDKRAKGKGSKAN